MDKDVASTGVSTRERGAVGFTGERSPETRQTAVALSRGSCRRWGARASELRPLGGSGSDGDHASMVERARGDGDWPELPPEDIGDSGSARQIGGSLVALEVWSLGEMER